MIIESIITWMSGKLEELDEYKELFSLENFPLFKLVIDILFENYDGDKLEFLNICIKNEEVFSKLINDVVGHRVLKIIVKKVFEKEEYGEYRECIVK